MSTPSGGPLSDVLGRAVLEGGPSSRCSTPTGPRTTSRSSPGLLSPSWPDTSFASSRSLRPTAAAGAAGRPSAGSSVSAVRPREQRFGTDKQLDEGPRISMARPSDRFDEMPELELAGRRGCGRSALGCSSIEWSAPTRNGSISRRVAPPAHSYEVDGSVVAARLSRGSTSSETSGLRQKTDIPAAVREGPWPTC